MDTDFTPDWIEALVQQYKDEVEEEAQWPILLMATPVRSRVWSLCGSLAVSSRGVPGCACRLLELYLRKHCHEFLQDSPDSDEWERYKEMIESRIYLLVASCVMLAAKMNKVQAPVTASCVRAALLKVGVGYRKEEIIESEFSVYQTLDFRIPLWTTTEMAQFLALQVGLGTSTEVEVVGLVSNIAEFYRNRLETHLNCLTDKPLSSSDSTSHTCNGCKKSSVHNLHLAAASVAASARYMLLTIDPTRELARITRSTALYINAVADVIVTFIFQKKHTPNILKRRKLM